MTKSDLHSEILEQARQIDPATTYGTVRSQALAQYNAIGIPDQRFEEWKYAATHLFRKTDSGRGDVNGLSVSDACRIDITGTTIDAEAIQQLSNIAGVYAATIDSNTIAIAGSNALGTEVLHAIQNVADNSKLPFASAHLASHSSVLVIKTSGIVSQAIHLCYALESTGKPLANTPLVVIIAEKNSKIIVVEEFRGADSVDMVVNSVTSIVAMENSSIDYIKLNHGPAQKAISHGVAEVCKGAVLSAYTVCLPSGFVRNDLHVRLVDSTAHANLFGVTVISAHDVADNHTVVDHMAANCTSNQLYKGLYAGDSTGVFNGKIYVRPDAQKTLAYQSNHSLLLSNNAQVNTKPQLEIWADDVKCSHGATTGQIDGEAIFYLRARGLSEDQARILLTKAFVEEVVEKFPMEDVRRFLFERIESILAV